MTLAPPKLDGAVSIADRLPDAQSPTVNAADREGESDEDRLRDSVSTRSCVRGVEPQSQALLAHELESRPRSEVNQRSQPKRITPSCSVASARSRSAPVNSSRHAAPQ